MYLYIYTSLCHVVIHHPSLTRLNPPLLPFGLETSWHCDGIPTGHPPVLRHLCNLYHGDLLRHSNQYSPSNWVVYIYICIYIYIYPYTDLYSTYMSHFLTITVGTLDTEVCTLTHIKWKVNKYTTLCICICCVCVCVSIHTSATYTYLYVHT